MLFQFISIITKVQCAGMRHEQIVENPVYVRFWCTIYIMQSAQEQSSGDGVRECVHRRHVDIIGVASEKESGEPQNIMTINMR